jgi:hypothetical protein
MLKLKLTENGDRNFVAIVEQVLNNTLQLYYPAEVYVILIDNWFDYKWLKFSGTVMHEIAVWKYKLTVPPFHPSRVVSQSYFHASNTVPIYYEAAPSKPLHIIQHSNNNLHRMLEQISLSGVFVWYSSSKHSDRGSLMPYAIDEENANAWYASFRKDEEWRLDKIKGITRREFIRLMEQPQQQEQQA